MAFFLCMYIVHILELVLNQFLQIPRPPVKHEYLFYTFMPSACDYPQQVMTEVRPDLEYSPRPVPEVLPVPAPEVKQQTAFGQALHRKER